MGNCFKKEKKDNDDYVSIVVHESDLTIKIPPSPTLCPVEGCYSSGCRGRCKPLPRVKHII